MLKETFTVTAWVEERGFGFAQSSQGQVFLHRTKKNLAHGDFEIHKGQQLIGIVAPSVGKKFPSLVNFEPAPEKFPDSPAERDALLTEQVYSEILRPLAERRPKQ